MFFLTFGKFLKDSDIFRGHRHFKQDYGHHITTFLNLQIRKSMTF